MSGFGDETFAFLEELEANNNRDWFSKNKPRYETHVLEPALAFIRTMQPRLQKISPCFEAIDKKVGGSLMRIYRDTRFSKDKTPYKTNVGIQFRHELGRDVHAPGFYLHLAADACFFGAGIWMPESAVLKKLRAAIDEEPAAWKRVKNNKRFSGAFRLAGESLKTAPAGYPQDHPLIEDLRRKSYIGIGDVSRTEALSPDFADCIADRAKASRPLMQWLCRTLGLPF